MAPLSPLAPTQTLTTTTVWSSPQMMYQPRGGHDVIWPLNPTLAPEAKTTVIWGPHLAARTPPAEPFSSSSSFSAATAVVTGGSSPAIEARAGDFWPSMFTQPWTLHAAVVTGGPSPAIDARAGDFWPSMFTQPWTLHAAVAAAAVTPTSGTPAAMTGFDTFVIQSDGFWPTVLTKSLTLAAAADVAAAATGGLSPAIEAEAEAGHFPWPSIFTRPRTNEGTQSGDFVTSTVRPNHHWHTLAVVADVAVPTSTDVKRGVESHLSETGKMLEERQLVDSMDGIPVHSALPTDGDQERKRQLVALNETQILDGHDYCDPNWHCGPREDDEDSTEKGDMVTMMMESGKREYDQDFEGSPAFPSILKMTDAEIEALSPEELERLDNQLHDASAFEEDRQKGSFYPGYDDSLSPG